MAEFGNKCPIGNKTSSKRPDIPRLCLHSDSNIFSWCNTVYEQHIEDLHFIDTHFTVCNMTYIHKRDGSL